MCVRLAVVIAIAVAAGACSAPANERVKRPTPIAAAPVVVEPVDAPSPPKYIEECRTRFDGDPWSYAPSERPRAAPLIAHGDRNAAQARGETEPAKLGSLWLGALDAYRRALVADPYRADVTLKLALVYDTLRRKGCALALLRRLSDLERHPLLEPEAARAIERVLADEDLFVDYRADALRALGR